MLEKIRLHGNKYIGEFLDGGSAAHLNSDSHLSAEQYKYLLKYTREGKYETVNNPEMDDILRKAREAR
jgi:hypothetical protein